MSKYAYAQTAIKAVSYINENHAAEEAWEKASCEFFEEGSDGQRKTCPRAAFYGLFSKNPVKLAGKNASYAQKAVEILKKNPDCNFTASELWKVVMADEPKQHNYQMDVVLALWESKLIT